MCQIKPVFPYLDDPGIDFVQGNAADLPAGDQSLDFMYLLNSWEHFQAPSDVAFLIEAERCLSRGGKVAIVPLKCARHAFVRTDPEMWTKKQVYDQTKKPLFRDSVPVEIEPCKQVYDQFHDAELLLNFAEQTPALSYEVVTAELSEKQEWFRSNVIDILIATRR